MAPAAPPVSRGRPRKYSTDIARAQARRLKVRQYVQAHRERRKQIQTTAHTNDGLDAGAGRQLENTEDRCAVNTRSLQADSISHLTVPSSAGHTTNQVTCAVTTAACEGLSDLNTCSRANQYAVEHAHQRKPVADHEDLPSAISNNPLTLLSASTSSPLRSARSDFPIQPCDYEVLDHSITNQWPKFSFSSAESAIAAIKSDIARAAMSNRASFYATLFAGSTHLAYRSIRAGLSVDDRAQSRRLVYKVKAIEALRAEIALQQQSSDTDGSHLDSIVMCVLTLAAHGTGEDIVSQARKSVSDSNMDPTNFLATVQDVDYYSAMNSELQHWKIIEALVQRRGGLAAVQISGLACAVALYDVFMARRTLSQPRFPVLLSAEQAMLGLSSMLPPHASTFPKYSGFEQILCHQRDDLHASLLNVLRHLRVITSALDVLDGMLALQQPPMSDLQKRKQLLTAVLWTRHLVQHALLSLPRDYPGSERRWGTMLHERRLYEMSHLTALIYCEMVISPMLGAHEMRTALCDRLENQLDWWRDGIEHEGDMTQHLVGWATLLCAMYCREQAGKSAAARFLKRTLHAISERKAIPTRIAKWSDAKLCLGVEHFLWASRFMDAKAQQFWDGFMI